MTRRFFLDNTYAVAPVFIPPQLRINLLLLIKHVPLL